LGNRGITLGQLNAASATNEVLWKQDQLWKRSI